MREIYDAAYVDEINGRIESAADDEALRLLAMEVLTIPESSAAYPDAIGRAVPASMPDPDVLGRLLDSWRHLTPERRWRLMEMAEDMHVASTDQTKATPQHKPPTKEQ